MMRSPAAAALRGAETPREPPRPSAVKVRAMARLQQHRANGVFNSNSPLAISKAKTPRTSSGSGGARPKRSEEEKAARKTKAGNKRMHNLDIAEVCERHGACTVAEVEAVFAAKQKTAAEREHEDLLIAALKAQYKADIAEAKVLMSKTKASKAQCDELEAEFKKQEAGLEAKFEKKEAELKAKFGKKEAEFKKQTQEFENFIAKSEDLTKRELELNNEFIELCQEQRELEQHKESVQVKNLIDEVKSLRTEVDSLKKKLQKQNKNKRNHKEQEHRRELGRAADKENNKTRESQSGAKRQRVATPSTST